MKPWFHVVQPREDLRQGKPLDASEFAVHLDHVREGRAPEDYRVPERFFDRTYLTHTLRDLAAQVVRRLSDECRIQHGDSVRRRQDACADAALPPGSSRSKSQRLDRGAEDLERRAGR